MEADMEATVSADNVMSTVMTIFFYFYFLKRKMPSEETLTKARIIFLLKEFKANQFNNSLARIWPFDVHVATRTSGQNQLQANWQRKRMN